MKFTVLSCLALLGAALNSARACDLCAIYNSSNARGDSANSLVFTVAEQFVPYRTLQFEGVKFSLPDPEYVESSFTHLVAGYNFSSRFGVSLNVPIIYRQFRRYDLQSKEEGAIGGVGDAALVGRWTVFQQAKMKSSIIVNLLGGVKLPTGDTDRLKEEFNQASFYNSLFPPGHQHGVLPATGVHQHDLSLGSGSFDAILGATVNLRWKRWFFNSQFQYYFRTEGESTFQYGDDLIVSGGPGAYALLGQKYTLSLQAHAVYDSMARDSILGQKSDHTGMTAWYLGPQLSFTLGERFSAQAGVDGPLRIGNNGFQSVPDYRLHGSLTRRF